MILLLGYKLYKKNYQYFSLSLILINLTGIIILYSLIFISFKINITNKTNLFIYPLFLSFFPFFFSNFSFLPNSLDFSIFSYFLITDPFYLLFPIFLLVFLFSILLFFNS